jgi:hypothetical protein
MNGCDGILSPDGSPHDWLEDRGPKMCLMGAVDKSKVALQRTMTTWLYAPLGDLELDSKGLPVLGRGDLRMG